MRDFVPVPVCEISLRFNHGMTCIMLLSIDKKQITNYKIVATTYTFTLTIIQDIFYFFLIHLYSYFYCPVTLIAFLFAIMDYTLHFLSISFHYITLLTDTSV